MKTRINTKLAVTVLTAMMITGCSGSKDTAAPIAPNAPNAPNAPSASANTDTATAETKTYEVGCGGCIFEMADAEGCEAAVKIDGTAYRIEGVEIPAHKIGLCSASTVADMAGEVQDGIFVATSFALTETDDDADADQEGADEGADQEGDKQEGSRQKGADDGGQGHEGHGH